MVSHLERERDRGNTVILIFGRLMLSVNLKKSWRPNFTRLLRKSCKFVDSILAASWQGEFEALRWRSLLAVQNTFPRYSNKSLQISVDKFVCSSMPMSCECCSFTCYNVNWFLPIRKWSRLFLLRTRNPRLLLRYFGARFLHNQLHL